MKKNKAIFSCSVAKVYNKDIDKYFSSASLEKLRPLMPEGISLNNNPDLIGIVLNSAVAGRMNRNGEAITKEQALAITDNFKFKYVNLEHDIKHIVGSIVNVGFSKFGSDEILSREDAEKTSDPFNITLACVIYKMALSDKFVELLESSVDQTSDKYGLISASWEIYFDGYDIAIGSKNVNEAKIITDEKEKEKYKPILKQNGGSGKSDGDHVYRIIGADYLLPAGIGLVEHPAAEVKGLIIVEDGIKDANTLIQGSAENLNRISQLTDKNVIEIKPKDIMIKSLEEIKELLKEGTSFASVQKFLEEQIAEAGKQFKEQVQSKETELKELASKNDSLASRVSELSEKLDKTLSQFNKLAEAKEIADQEKISLDRVEAIKANKAITLTTEQLDLVRAKVSKIKTDEDFAAYVAELQLFAATPTHSQTTPKEASKASVEGAVKNADTQSSIEIDSSTPLANLADSYKDAFQVGKTVTIK